MLSEIVLSLVILVVLFKLFAILTCGRCKSKVCLLGKTAIITGGNSGIGYEVALALAARGCKVIIADKDDCTTSIKNIIKETHNPNISSKFLDLSSFKSVRTFAQEIIDSQEPIHILCNNAGIGSYNLKFTEDGIQYTMQINFFGHFLLTHLLVDVLKKSAPSRIIFTSSLAAIFNNFSLEDLLPKKSHSSIYTNSKLCCIIASNKFAEKLKGTGVTSNSCNPGATKTRIFNTAMKLKNVLILQILQLGTLIWGKTPEEGAQSIIYLATANEVQDVSGSFFSDCRKFFQPLICYKKEICQKVWEESEKIVNLNDNEKLV